MFIYKEKTCIDNVPFLQKRVFTENKKLTCIYKVLTIYKNVYLQKVSNCSQCIYPLLHFLNV